MRDRGQITVAVASEASQSWTTDSGSHNRTAGRVTFADADRPADRDDRPQVRRVERVRADPVERQVARAQQLGVDRRS